MLSSDEMILQIRKGNEEAMELLFNYCDIYGNKLLRKIKQNYSFLGIEYEDIKSYFKERVYDTIIPRLVRLSEAPSHGKPIIAYDPHSRGTEAYLNLAKEVIERNGN